MLLSTELKLLVAVTVLAVCSIIAYALWVHYLKKRAEKLCGHYVYIAAKIPLLGNALDFFSLKTAEDVWNFITYSGIRFTHGVMYFIFHIQWMVVQELDVVEAVLSSFETVDKSHIYQLFDTITDGVFSINGIRWKKLRKRTNLTFSQKQLDLFYQDMSDQTAVCIDVLMKNCYKYVNIITFITTYFLDTVARTHFGVATTEQIDRKTHTTENIAKLIELTITNRFFKPIYHSRLLFKLTRVSCFIDYYKEKPTKFLRKMVQKRLEDVEIEKTKGVHEEKRKICFVDLVKETLEEFNMKPTIYNLERNTGDMLIAASDTTSIAVSSFFYYIALYPEIQEKIYEEVLPIFEDNRTKEFSKDDLNRMMYLEMVIKETLRHVAPAGIVRQLEKDLDVGKYTIPKRTNIYLALNTIHNSPKYYEKPNEFYPEHFLPEKVKQRPKYAFLPFSAGPRNCPGMAYAYMSMKCITSAVVRNFKLETNIPLKDIQYKQVLMQEQKNGYYIKLTPRSDINFNAEK